MRSSSSLLSLVLLAGCGARSELPERRLDTGVAGSSAGAGAQPSGQAPACDPELSPERRYAAGPEPSCLAAGDLDGDGDLDLLTCHGRANAVSVLLNDGRGGFAAPRGFSAEQPSALALGDLDGDERADVVVGNGHACTVSVHRNLGGATLGGAESYASGCDVNAALLRDFDADGRLDLATANNASATLSVLLNAGATLGAPASYDFGSRPSSLVAGDWDGDGRLDLAATSWGFLPQKDASPILGLFQNVGGRFVTSGSYAVGGTPEALATGDFDADGHADLALGYSFDSGVNVYLNQSDGSFALPPVRYSTDLSPIDVASGDLNGDTRLDLVTANNSSDNLSVLLGQGDGTFAPARQYDAVEQPSGLVLADLNADGRLDVAVAGFGAGAVGIFLSRCR